MAAIEGYNYFTINNATTGFSNVFITKRTKTLPTRKNETAEAPYRNGTIIELSDFYSNFTIEYECFCFNKTKKKSGGSTTPLTAVEIFRSFTKYLTETMDKGTENGYFRLRDTYENPYMPNSSLIPAGSDYQDVFCFAYLESISNVEVIGKDEAVTFTLTFNCRPKWYFADYDTWTKYESDSGKIEIMLPPDYETTTFPAFKFYGSSRVYIRHVYTDTEGKQMEEDCGQFQIADLPDTTSGNYYLFDLDTLELTFVSSDQTTSYNQALTMLSTARPRVPATGTTYITVSRPDGKAITKMIRFSRRGFRL